MSSTARRMAHDLSPSLSHGLGLIPSQRLLCQLLAQRQPRRNRRCLPAGSPNRRSQIRRSSPPVTHRMQQVINLVFGRQLHGRRQAAMPSRHWLLFHFAPSATPAGLGCTMRGARGILISLARGRTTCSLASDWGPKPLDAPPVFRSTSKGDEPRRRTRSRVAPMEAHPPPNRYKVRTSARQGIPQELDIGQPSNDEVTTPMYRHQTRSLVIRTSTQ